MGSYSTTTTSFPIASARARTAGNISLYPMQMISFLWLWLAVLDSKPRGCGADPSARCLLCSSSRMCASLSAIGLRVDVATARASCQSCASWSEWSSRPWMVSFMASSSKEDVPVWRWMCPRTMVHSHGCNSFWVLASRLARLVLESLFFIPPAPDSKRLKSDSTLRIAPAVSSSPSMMAIPETSQTEAGGAWPTSCLSPQNSIRPARSVQNMSWLSTMT
mmetsp:Transcript_6302/g.13878  ORF Transcript_6302/g.13878 Transcript_6302/m.13878 type:complete len:220 (-) Transcript_6302:415-1074(-)